MQKPARTIARHALLIVSILALAACKKTEGSMDDDFDMGPMMMFRMMGMGMMVIIPILILSLLVPAVLYAFARSRANREPYPDRQLGAKFALGYFQVTSFQILLTGTFVLLYALMSKMPSEFKGDIYRIAFGVIIPAAIIFAVHTYGLTRSNQREFPIVGRLWAGYNLMITGLLGAFALIAFFVVLLQKGESGDVGRMTGAMLLVYTTAWGVLAAMFIRRSFSEPQALTPGPQHGQQMPPPGPPPPMHQPLGGPPPGGQRGY